MSDTKDVFESERARLDKKYKELTNNRVKSFVKQAGSTGYTLGSKIQGARPK